MGETRSAGDVVRAYLRVLETGMWGETDLWALMRQLGKVPADISLE